MFDSVTVWSLHVKANKDIKNWYGASKPGFYFIQTAYFSLLGLFNLCRVSAPVTLVFVRCDNLHYLAARVSSETDPKVEINIWKTKDAWKQASMCKNRFVHWTSVWNAENAQASAGTISHLFTRVQVSGRRRGRVQDENRTYPRRMIHSKTASVADTGLPRALHRLPSGITGPSHHISERPQNVIWRSRSEWRHTGAQWEYLKTVHIYLSVLMF